MSDKDLAPRGRERCANCRHRRDSHLAMSCTALVNDTVCTCPEYVGSGVLARKREEVWYGRTA